MWIMLNDAFLSIFSKDCPPGHLLVRARRPGDIERVFGRRIKVERLTDADYLFRARIPRQEVEAAMIREIAQVNYSNFKDSVKDHDLHSAYHRVWHAMAATQNPPPYSRYTPKHSPGLFDGLDTKRPAGQKRKGKKPEESPT